jgi:hypothetical protein
MAKNNNKNKNNNNNKVKSKPLELRSRVKTTFFGGVRVYFVKNPQYQNIPVLRSEKPVLNRFRY